MSDAGSDGENLNHDFLQQELDRIDEIHESPLTDVHDLETVLRKELEVYSNVIPAYEIEQPNRIEEKLINLYHKYLVSLIAMVDKSNSLEIRRMGSSILAELASISFAFNYSRTLLSVVVRCANDSSIGISAPCIATLKELITLDASSRMILAVLDELTDILEEVPKKSRKSVFFSPTLLRLLIMIHSKDVDMYRTIHSNEPQSDLPESLPLAKELKRKRSKLDKKMQLVHRTQEAGDLASIQSGLFQKVIYFLLRVLKNCTLEIQNNNECINPSVEQTLLTILYGFAKYGSFLNAELVDLLNQALWDLYESIEKKVENGTNRTSGSAQIQCNILCALYRFFRLQRHTEKRGIPINFENNATQRAIPHDTRSLQLEFLRLIDDFFAMPMPYSIKTNQTLPEVSLVGETGCSDESQPVNTAPFLENAVRASWKKQIDRFIETATEVFEIERHYRAAMGSRHKRHKYSIASEVKTLFYKVIEFAMCSPPCISQKLEPLVKTLIAIFTECYSSVRLATDDAALIKSGERDDLYWLVFAYRTQAGMQNGENLDETFTWMTS